MVIKDFTRGDPDNTGESSNSASTQLRDQLAKPLDRFGAVAIDLSAILLPLLLLVSSPLKRKLTESLVLHEEVGFFVSLAGMIAIFLLAIVFYQATMLRWFGATLGKMFFNLKVVNIWNRSTPNFSSSLLRSTIWVAECGMLFIPHLSVFSNDRRRPFHDRVADTVVVATGKSRAVLPTIFEISFVRGVFSAAAMFLLLIVFANSKIILNDLRQQASLMDLLDGKKALCASVEEALKTWPTNEVKASDARVRVAMALFAAGEVSKTCLQQEVSFFIKSMKEESPLAYLAQAFIHSSQPEISNRYLSRVCELDESDPSCLMSRVVEYWSEKKWTDVENTFDSLRGEVPVHIAVWAIRHYTKRRIYSSAQRLIDTVSPQKALSHFLSEHRVRVSWWQGQKDQARAIAATALELTDGNSKMELAGWLCLRELQEGCTGVDSYSCRTVARSGMREVDQLFNSEVALATIKQLACQSDENLMTLATLMPLPGAKKFISAMHAKHSKNTESAKAKFREITQNKELSDVFRGQAQVELVKVSDGNELNDLKEQWKQSELGDEWVEWGQALVSRFYEKGSFSSVIEVGQKLKETNVTDHHLDRAMIVAAYQMGKRRLAWDILVEASFYSGDIALRGPASIDPTDTYSVIFHRLQQEFAESRR